MGIRKVSSSNRRRPQVNWDHELGGPYSIRIVDAERMDLNLKTCQVGTKAALQKLVRGASRYLAKRECSPRKSRGQTARWE